MSSQNITKNSELLPCPFCGEQAKVYVHAEWHYAGCANEFCIMNYAFPTEAEAIAAWNTRAKVVSE